MKKLVLGAALAGGLLLGLRAAVRHCQTMMGERCGGSDAHSCQCA